MSALLSPFEFLDQGVPVVLGGVADELEIVGGAFHGQVVPGIEWQGYLSVHDDGGSFVGVMGGDVHDGVAGNDEWAVRQ
jgi:hypothetical protein